MTQFSYSIVIPTYNEIRDLEVTVATVWASEPRPKEIIVVDDCGDDDVVERLSSFNDLVRVVTPSKRLGSGAAKRYGATLATGDVIIIMDSHMRVPYDWLVKVDEAVDRFPEAIFCVGCKNFTCDWLGCGARFSRTNTRKTGDIFIGQSWLDRGDDSVVDRCPSLLGGCYIIPRFIWEVLGGMNPCFHGWGYEEQDLSLRAWLSGFEVRRINSVVIQHRFQRELKKPKKGFIGTFAHFNAMAVCASIFEDGVFERLYYPYFKQIAPVDAILEFEEKLDEVNMFREFVQSKRMFADEDLHALCGFRLPTPHEQQQMTDTLVTDRCDRNREQRKNVKPCNNCIEVIRA